MELITFSLIATDDGGAFVFAWQNGGDSVCRPLAASLDRLSDDAVPHAILLFVFEFCENHYMRPDWWDQLDAKGRAALTARLQLSASSWEPRSSSCLRDDGLRLVSWKIATRTWL